MLRNGEWWLGDASTVGIAGASVVGNWMGDGTSWLKGLRVGETAGEGEKDGAEASWRIQSGWEELWKVVTVWKRGKSRESV